MYCGTKMWLNQGMAQRVGLGGLVGGEGAAHGFYCACLLSTAKFGY